MLAPVDLVIVEGFKREAHAKVEVFRRAVGKPALYPDDPRIVGWIGDGPAPGLPHAHIDDVAAAADLLLACALPLDVALEGLRAQR